MKTNLSLKVLSLLLAGMMTFGLASCEDDEIEVMPDFNEPEVNTPIPTEDEVKTTVGKSYAVLGEHFDEVTPYVLKRMTGQRYDYAPSDTHLPDDVEVVFLDYDALLDISEEMAYEIKEVFDRGGAIYLHKPHSMALGFFALVLYDQMDDFMAWLEEQLKDGGTQTKAGKEGNLLERDSYIIRFNDHLDVRDIYNGKSFIAETTVTETAEDGSEQTNTVTETLTPEEPSDYEYGLFAEKITEWLNKEETKTRASDGEMLNSAALESIILPCHLQRFADRKTFTFCGELKVWVSTLYNFDTKQDYYHVLLEETYPGDALNFGQYYSKKYDVMGYRHKVAGYTYGGLSVRPTLDTKGYTLKDMWNPQPENEGTTQKTDIVDGWSLNADLGYDDGLTAKLTGGFTHQQTVSNISKEININLKKDGAAYFWEYDIDHKYRYKDGGIKNGSLNSQPDKNSISIKNCKTRQSWNWLVDNTEGRGNNPFNMEVALEFRAKYANCFGSSPGYGETKVHNSKHLIQLPVPNRFTKSFSVVADDYLDNTEMELIQTFLNSVQEYKNISKGYCAPTEKILDQQMKARWNETIETLKSFGSKFSALKNDYTFRLKDNKGNQIGDELRISNKGINK